MIRYDKVFMKFEPNHVEMSKFKLFLIFPLFAGVYTPPVESY